MEDRHLEPILDEYRKRHLQGSATRGRRSSVIVQEARRQGVGAGRVFVTHAGEKAMLSIVKRLFAGEEVGR